MLFNATRSRIGRLAFVAVLAASVVTGRAVSAALSDENGVVTAPVPVEFFFETGCTECERVRREVLPELDRRYSGYVVVQQRDIEAETNYLALVAYGQKQGLAPNEPVCMVVDRREMLPGFERIRNELFAAVDRAIARRDQDSEAVRQEPPPPQADADLLRRHVSGFTLAGVLSAALVDSINPCAMATLVFFMSLLLSSNVGTRKMLLAGGSFVVACFFTYLAIGFGLLRLLFLLTKFNLLKTVVDGVLIATLLVLSALSFRDAARFRRTGKASDIAVRLPQGVQRRIHEAMKRGLRNRSLVLGGLGIGVVVTALESMCTGQVYVPALVLMIKSGQSAWRSAAYLGLYNLIFVMPLVILLLLGCFGLRTPTLVAWSRKNVVVGKTLLGLFFLGMAAMMLALMR